MESQTRWRSGGIELKPGDVVPNGLYAVSVPALGGGNSRLGALIRRAERMKKESGGNQRGLLKRAAYDLSLAQRLPINWHEHRGRFVIDLDECLERGIGMCHEWAMAESIILNSIGVEALFSPGLVDSGMGARGHAWVNADIYLEGERVRFLDDAKLGVLVPRGEATGYREASKRIYTPEEMADPETASRLVAGLQSNRDTMDRLLDPGREIEPGREGLAEWARSSLLSLLWEGGANRRAPPWPRG